MGTGAPSRNAQLSITDPKVCRSYLVGTCPHDLFTNTKQDLGPCPKVHSEGLKTEYETASAAEKAKWGFDFDYMRDMQKYIDDCDRRIDSAQRRLEKTPDEIRQTNNLVRIASSPSELKLVANNHQLKQISDYTKTINGGLLEISVLGETGSVAQAYNELHKIRTAKHQKETCERELKNLQDTSGPSGHQKLQVCDVCGAYLSRLDNDRRLADHFFGKMHMGYSDMRKTFKKLSEELKGRPPPVRHHDDEEGGWGGRSGGGRGPRYGGGGGYKKRGGRW
ncbi:unnamed protein product [Aspergillus oryzae]|uniref:Unnamed protein product n=1 Tax=Aspergillus oryzae var. brunneus TaxID=332754 RepID=A0ABQ6L352_ASPOZ|nr:unnamed protein product [Aspergillus oryzae]GMF89277.1 unnamed protein product [Aspergillus oryzae]GMG03048.1 unnamed protein product [Aspergillus oryzae]GMG50888.1 unnamed protein product [Aspergillus oryzae var. brunneus]